MLFLEIEFGALAQGEIELSAINVLVFTVLTAILGIALVAIAVQEALEIRHGAARNDPISGFLDQRTFEQACEPALATGLPATASLRWLEVLEKKGLVFAYREENEIGQIYVRLSSKGLQDMTRYLDHIAHSETRESA